MSDLPQTSGEPPEEQVESVPPVSTVPPVVEVVPTPEAAPVSPVAHDQWLAMGRRWHLFFAWIFVINGLLFGLYAILSRHLTRDLFPWWRDLRGLGRTLLDHLLFRHPTGDEAKRYNVLQKIAYTGVIFGLGPLIVLTGLSISPIIDAASHGL